MFWKKLVNVHACTQQKDFLIPYSGYVPSGLRFVFFSFWNKQNESLTHENAIYTWERLIKSYYSRMNVWPNGTYTCTRYTVVNCEFKKIAIKNLQIKKCGILTIFNVTGYKKNSKNGILKLNKLCVYPTHIYNYIHGMTQY